MASRGAIAINAAIAGWQLFDSGGKKASDWARAGGAAIITGTAAIPVIGPSISFGLGIADSAGLFNSTYELADHPSVINFYWDNPSLILKK